MIKETEELYEKNFKNNFKNLETLINLSFCEFNSSEKKDIKKFFKISRLTLRQKHIIFSKCVKRISFLPGYIIKFLIKQLDETSFIRELFQIISNGGHFNDDSKKGVDLKNDLKLKYGFEYVFSKDGPLASLKEYEYRQKQVRMADIIKETFEKDGIALIEAGCGIGKTFSYLIPALYEAAANGSKIAVSTNTKTLQSQIYEKDMVFIEKKLDIKIPMCVIKGRKNYPCLRKIINELKYNGNDTNVFYFLLSVLISIYSEKIIDLNDVFVPVFAPYDIINKINGSFENCVFYDCPHFSKNCVITALKRKAKKSKIIITNHSLIFSDYASSYRLISDCDGIIFDEAQAVENTVIDSLKIEITPYALNKSLNNFDLYGNKFKTAFMKKLSLNNECSTVCLNAADYVPLVKENGILFFEELNGLLTNNYYKKRIDNNGDLIKNIIDKSKEFVKNFEQLIFYLDDLKTKIEDIEDKDLILEYEKAFLNLKEFYGNLKFILNFNETDFVYWIEKNKLIASPVKADDFCRKFFETLSFAVLISATMTVNGSFDYLKKKLGLLNSNRLFEAVIGEGFDYDKQCGVFINTAPLNINTPEYFKTIFEIVNAVIEGANGGTLILFTSYAALFEIKKLMKKREYNRKIFFHNKKESVLQKFKLFKEDEKSVLLGTNSFWEGIDIPGPSLKAIIIVKMPFFHPADPVVEARLEKIRDEGGNPFNEFMLPGMITRLKQGFGRLIRSKTDKGFIVICDNRIIGKNYSKTVLSNIPVSRFKWFSTVNELKEHIKEYK